jgi:hypothetical protein
LDLLFQTTFEKSLPGDIRPLSESEPLRSSEPTLVVVPQITALRLYKDTAAGALDRYSAIVVGDVALVDPWSLGRVFAATRMVTGVAELASNRTGSPDPDLRNAFRAALQQWMKECLTQIREQAHPFVLAGGILGTRPSGLAGGGGIWPFGRANGVGLRMVIQGDGARYARVREVFDNFSVLEDAADPARKLATGEPYRLIIVKSNSQADREEPRLSLRWIGPYDPQNDPKSGEALPKEAWLGILASYLSKDGHYRVLPLPIRGHLDQDDPWQRLKENLARFSESIEGNTQLIQQDVLAASLQESADIEVELGLMDAYHGQRPGLSPGSKEQLYRAEWGLAWFERPEKEGPAFFRGEAFLPESKAVVTKDGVREFDTASLWFKVMRDGLVRMAETTRSRLPVPRSGLGTWYHTMVPASGLVAWNHPPVSGNFLEWRRPGGVVLSESGKVLGTYFRKMGTIKAGQSTGANLQPGDELTYLEVGSEHSQYSIGPIDRSGSDWMLPSRWLQILLANELSKVVPADYELTGSGPDIPGTRFIVLKVESFPIQADVNEINLRINWRMRVFDGPPTAEASPLFKAGLARSSHAAQSEGQRPLNPSNTGALSIEVQHTDVVEFIRFALTKGLREALSKEIP